MQILMTLSLKRHSKNRNALNEKLIEIKHINKIAKLINILRQ